MNQNYSRLDTSAKFILNRLLLVVFFVLLIIYSSSEIIDSDLWLHLKTGEIIAKNHFIPLSDIFSFALNNKPWINHEWLFQLIAYLSYNAASFDGLIAMQNIVLIATFLLLLSIGLKEKNHIFVFVVLYVTLLCSAYRFMVRPDIFSLFFISLYLVILKKFKDKKSKTIWLLPIIQIFWTNMHGFFFMGPLLILIFLKEEPKTLLKILILSLFATLVNPHGLKGALYPVNIFFQLLGESKIFFTYIQELARPITLKTIFNFKHFLFYKIIILVAIFSFRFNSKNLNISNIILWLLAFMFSLMAIRNIAYFAIISAYIIFENTTEGGINKKEMPFKFLNHKTFKNISYYAFTAFLFYYPIQSANNMLSSASFNFETYSLKSMLWGVSSQKYPRKAVDFILENNFPEPMFNDFNSGAYLIGRTCPKRKVFIDGRTELYGPGFFKTYSDVVLGKKEAIEEIMQKYNISGFFLTNYPDDLHVGLLHYLLENPLWTLVYFDETASIFIKNSPENLNTIRKYRIDLKSYASREPDFIKLGVAFRYPAPYIRRANILNRIKYYEASASEAKIALLIMPHNAEAMSYVADYLIEKKDYTQALRYVRNCLVFVPDNSHMKCQLALLYYHLNNQEKAQKTIDAIIKNNKKLAEAYYTKALIQDKTENIKKLLEKAIELAPKEQKYKDKLVDFLKHAGA